LQGLREIKDINRNRNLNNIHPKNNFSLFYKFLVDSTKDKDLNQFFKLVVIFYDIKLKKTEFCKTYLEIFENYFQIKEIEKIDLSLFKNCL